MSVVVALDYGVKKMGVAVGNTELKTAQPEAIFPMNNGQPNWENLLSLITTWQAQTVLVGLPLHIDGSESHLSKRATKFAKRLHHKLKEIHHPVTMVLVDERLSSHEARSLTNNQGKKTNIDDTASLVILESWLNDAQGVTLP